MALDESTLKLHIQLLRHLKGAWMAYEEWVRANQPPPTIELDPDPVKHFEQRTKK